MKRILIIIALSLVMAFNASAQQKLSFMGIGFDHTESISAFGSKLNNAGFSTKVAKHDYLHMEGDFMNRHSQLKVWGKYPHKGGDWTVLTMSCDYDSTSNSDELLSTYKAVKNMCLDLYGKPDYVEERSIYTIDTILNYDGWVAVWELQSGTVRVSTSRDSNDHAHVSLSINNIPQFYY